MRIHVNITDFFRLDLLRLIKRDKAVNRVPHVRVTYRVLRPLLLLCLVHLLEGVVRLSSQQVKLHLMVLVEQRALEAIANCSADADVSVLPILRFRAAEIDCTL